MFSRFRDLLKRIISPDEPIPLQPEPIPEFEDFLSEADSLAEWFVDNQRLRHGPLPVSIVKLTNTIRTMEYVGRDVSHLFIERGKVLTFEAIVIHPERGAYNVVGSLRSGETWTQIRETRQLASRLKKLDPSIEDGTDIVLNSTVKINWYITTYAPIPS